MNEVIVRFVRHPDDLDFDSLAHVHDGTLDDNYGWLTFTACAKSFVVDEVSTGLVREVDEPATCIECLGARPWVT